MKHFMKQTVYTVSISAVVVAAVLGLGGYAVRTQTSDMLGVQNVSAVESVITVTGREEVKVVSGMARVGYAVYTREDTAAACQEKNASGPNAATEILEDPGMEETSIQTSSYGLSLIRNQNLDKQEIVGYEMTTNLTASDISIDNIGTIMTKSMAVGINGINSVSYLFSSYDVSYQEVLEGATAMIQARAQAPAKAGARTSADTAHAEEFGYQSDTRYASYNSGGSAKMTVMVLEDAGAPVMPNQISVETQVTVSYELNEWVICKPYHYYLRVQRRQGYYEITLAGGGGKSRRDMLFSIMLCLRLITGSIIFLVQMIPKSQKENVAYLYDTTNQTRASILRQIEGGWQTLKRLAIDPKELATLDESRIMTTLKNINKEDVFIRMGYADINGSARMVDMGDSAQEINLRGMEFFEWTLQGGRSTSNTFVD